MLDCDSPAIGNRICSPFIKFGDCAVRLFIIMDFTQTTVAPWASPRQGGPPDDPPRSVTRVPWLADTSLPTGHGPTSGTFLGEREGPHSPALIGVQSVI